VLAFFVVVQRFENWRAEKKKAPAAQPASPARP
jgi:hydrophobic/amphiphilic exporter-1 (mainly G- bacteria), HAE1 family